ncbi:MAG: DUF1015 family protein, partial [Chloroflexota bacterium]
MADVRAFAGLRYDEEKAGDLAAVLAPPYDVIPEPQVATYRDRSPWNVVRLTRPGTDYEAAARAFADWQRDGLLKRD